MKDFETEWTTFPICPYCGKEDQGWRDRLKAEYDGDFWQVICDYCMKPYVVTISVSVHFDTRILNQPEKQEDQK